MRFFHTLREKLFVLKQFKRGSLVPIIKYTIFRIGLSRFLFLHRRYYRMRVWKSPFAFWLWSHENKKRKDEEFIFKFLRGGDVFVDCGAHLGTLTMTASNKVGVKGRVISCEPTPTTFYYLKENVSDNSCLNVSLHKLAIGEKIKSVMLETGYVSDMNHVSDTGKTEAQMTTLNHLLKNEKEITLLKLDIEGQELNAIIGADNILEKVKAVYFESAPATFLRMNYTLQNIVLELSKYGFKVYQQNDDFGLVEIDSEYETKQRYEDLIALKDLNFYSKRVLVRTGV